MEGTPPSAGQSEGHVFHRQTARPLPRAVRAEGVYVWDADGKRYIDGSGGAAVSCLGHSHPAVTEAIRAQLDGVTFAHTGFFTNDMMEALAADLVSDAPADDARRLGRVVFTSGGSESIEVALKLARQYHVEAGAPARIHIIARRQSYHGNSLGAMAAGHGWRRHTYAPMLGAAFHHIAPCYAYREQRPGETAEAYGRRAADELEAKIQELGPETVAAFIAEPVSGATLGAVPAVDGYFSRVREICDRHGVLLILDEVMCGMGRTGYRYACGYDGVVPDMIAIAKGLGGGYQPIGAVMVSDAIHATINEGSRALGSGHTYMGHPIACAAALAVQQVIREEGLLARVQEQGRALAEALDARFGQHPHVGDTRGRGLFQGIELVADRETKAPFAPELQIHARVKRAAMDRGLMCYPMGGTMDGRQGDHVLLAPPYIIDADGIAEIVDKLGAAIDAELAEIAAGG